jgi:hypothetical protein
MDMTRSRSSVVRVTSQEQPSNLDSCDCTSSVTVALVEQASADSKWSGIMSVGFEQTLGRNRDNLNLVRRFILCIGTEHQMSLALNCLVLIQVTLALYQRAWWTWCGPTKRSPLEGDSNHTTSGILLQTIDEEDVPVLRMQVILLHLRKVKEVITQLAPWDWAAAGDILQLTFRLARGFLLEEVDTVLARVSEDVV